MAHNPFSVPLLTHSGGSEGPLSGGGLGGAGAAQAQSVAPSEAPAEWVRYAETTTRTITGWLEEEGEAATAFRAHLHQTRPADDQATPPLVLKVWIEPDGRISRIDFAPFAQEAANASLRGLVLGRSVAAPPGGMLLPLRLSVQLEPPGPLEEVKLK